MPLNIFNGKAVVLLDEKIVTEWEQLHAKKLTQEIVTMIIMMRHGINGYEIDVSKLKKTVEDYLKNENERKAYE